MAILFPYEMLFWLPKSSWVQCHMLCIQRHIFSPPALELLLAQGCLPHYLFDSNPFCNTALNTCLYSIQTQEVIKNYMRKNWDIDVNYSLLWLTCCRLYLLWHCRVVRNFWQNLHFYYWEYWVLSCYREMCWLVSLKILRKNLTWYSPINCTMAKIHQNVNLQEQNHALPWAISSNTFNSLWKTWQLKLTACTV